MTFPRRLAFSLGVACAACCALPLLGLTAAGGLSLAASCVDELWPLFALLAASVAGWALWRWRRQPTKACTLDCSHCLSDRAAPGAPQRAAGTTGCGCR